MDGKDFVNNLRKEAREKYIPVMREQTTELLANIVSENKPERTLEIGTCLGVSGITVLISGGKRLTTVDIDGVTIAEAEKNFLACGVRDRVEFIEGDCFEVLKYMGDNRYDLVVLDGPKSKYCELYDFVFPMLNDGGIIFCDDVEFYGKVAQTEPERKHRTIIKGMQRFHEKVTSDKRVKAEFYSFEDGVAVIKKNQELRVHMQFPELLAPAGDMKKLKTALHFGADAVYFAGKKFGLRAFAGNFDYEELKKAFDLLHTQGKKGYVTLNIFASNSDFEELGDYVKYLSEIKADGVIISDPGVVSFVKNLCPDLDIHLSTQANTTNKYAVKFWRDIGVKRIVLARELDLDAIREISDFVGDTVELEAFVHGAMCISYSGRCLLSSYLTDRDSNRGECVQACRWEYAVSERSRVGKGEPLVMQEDERGTYILNSKDMNTLPILDKIVAAGINSLKIEGRMKSEYYVGSVVNAYRKRLDGIYEGRPYDPALNEQLYKVNHREYTTGFYLGKAEQCYETSKPQNPYTFAAMVLGYDEEKKLLKVEMRNRFHKGEILEAVSVTDAKTVKADLIFDADGNEIDDCKIVQQILFIKTDTKLEKYDMLIKANGGENAQ